MRSQFIQVSTTVDSKKAASSIATELLENRLASCVQVIGPITSHYWWEGRIQHAREWLCIIKAQAKDYRRIEAFIKRKHPYQVPEIIALPILYGNPEYTRWIARETTQGLKRDGRRRQ